MDSDPAKRDPRRAVKLAQEAVELSPKGSEYQNTLGIAQYRDGNWKDAVSALQKYRELRPYDWENSNPFFLAMARRQLGDKNEALGWYEKGDRWLNNFGSYDDDPMALARKEAAELLGVTSAQKRHASSLPSASTNPAVSGTAPIAEEPLAGELRTIRRATALHAASTFPSSRPAGPLIRAYDVPALMAHLGHMVAIDGRVRAVSFTTAHDAINIELAGPDVGSLLVWVSPDSYVKFTKEFGQNPEALLINHSIRVSGRLSRYAGRRPDWKDRLQMTLDDPSQISIVGDEPISPTTIP